MKANNPAASRHFGQHRPGRTMAASCTGFANAVGCRGRCPGLASVGLALVARWGRCLSPSCWDRVRGSGPVLRARCPLLIAGGCRDRGTQRICCSCGRLRRLPRCRAGRRSSTTEAASGCSLRRLRHLVVRRRGFSGSFGCCCAIYARSLGRLDLVSERCTGRWCYDLSAFLGSHCPSQVRDVRLCCPNRALYTSQCPLFSPETTRKPNSPSQCH